MRGLVSILSRLSLPALYRLADWLLYPLLYAVVRYRRKLVRENLTNAFPEKSKQEIRQLERKYYHHLADVIVEIVYSYRASDDDMRQRVRFINAEETIRLTKQYGGNILMLGHIGNWEWMAEVSRFMEQFGIESTHVYRKQRSESTNELMLYIRKRHHGNYCDKNLILRTMVRQRRREAPQSYGMIADQKPSLHGDPYTTNFLHQSTPFLTGSEVLSSKMGYPVFFFYIRQIERGVYTAEFKLLSEHPAAEPPGRITEAYVRLLEQNIEEAPELWLWSHNRWRR
ncbi:MAG: lysophospholipid acyltransferase family protein [Paludibacteraceae bacterium]|nr:lysophospholipid acyltransferase family protein [Paludibacteraceae bacterium]